MTYERFEDLPVWQAAADLYTQAEALLRDPQLDASGGWRNQFDRAALSVSNNIAEGFERGTTNELLAFLYIARGSAGEVRSMLCVRERRALAPEVKPLVARLKALAESCSRQLRGWAESLQNSPIQGQRHLNDKVRRRESEKQRVRDVSKKLLSMLSPHHPMRLEAERRELEQQEAERRAIKNRRKI